MESPLLQPALSPAPASPLSGPESGNQNRHRRGHLPPARAALIDGDLDFCALPLFPQNELLEYETIYLEEILMAIPKNHPINAHYPDTSANGERFPYIDLSLLKNEAFIGLKKIQKFSQMGLRSAKRRALFRTPSAKP